MELPTGDVLLKKLRAVINPKEARMKLSDAEDLIKTFGERISNTSLFKRGDLNHIAVNSDVEWRVSDDHTVRVELVICWILLSVQINGALELPCPEALRTILTQSFPRLFPRPIFDEKLLRFYALMKVAVRFVAGKGTMDFLCNHVVGPLSQPGDPISLKFGGGPWKDTTHLRRLIYEGLSGDFGKRTLGHACLSGLLGMRDVKTVRQKITPEFEHAWLGIHIIGEQVTSNACSSHSSEVDNPGSAAVAPYTDREQSRDDEPVMQDCLPVAEKPHPDYAYASGAEPDGNDFDDSDDFGLLMGHDSLQAAGSTDLNGLNSVETTRLPIRDVERTLFGLACNDDKQTPPVNPSVPIGADALATAYLTVGEQDTDQESVLGRRLLEHAQQQPQRSAALSADHRWERDSDVDMDKSIQSDDSCRDSKRRRRGSEDDLKLTLRDLLDWEPLIKPETMCVTGTRNWCAWSPLDCREWMGSVGMWE